MEGYYAYSFKSGGRSCIKSGSGSYSATLMIYTTKTSSLNYVKCVKPSIASCNMLVTLSAMIFLDIIVVILKKKNRENFGKSFFFFFGCKLT